MILGCRLHVTQVLLYASSNPILYSLLVHLLLGMSLLANTLTTSLIFWSISLGLRSSLMARSCLLLFLETVSLAFCRPRKSLKQPAFACPSAHRRSQAILGSNASMPHQLSPSFAYALLCMEPTVIGLLGLLIHVVPVCKTTSNDGLLQRMTVC